MHVTQTVNNSSGKHIYMTDSRITIETHEKEVIYNIDTNGIFDFSSTRHITKIYLYNVAISESQDVNVQIKRYYTNGTTDTYNTNITLVNGDKNTYIELPIYHPVAVRFVIISVHFNDSVPVDYSLNSIFIKTNEVKCYYTLKIIDILLNGENEILRTERNSYSNTYNSIVTISPCDKYPEGEYEFHTESQKIHIVTDTTVYCYYRKKYSKKIHDIFVKEVTKHLLEHNVIF